MLKLCAGVCLAVLMVGCGGGGNTPTTPSPTTTSIAVTLQEVLLVARTSAATATATLSNGQTRTITTGWQSSAPSIATVTDNGTVRGVLNGTVSISVSSGGQQGAKTIRIAPDYDGNWAGWQRVTACTDSRDFEGICDDPASVIGFDFPISLAVRQQMSLAVSGEFMVEQLDYPTFETEVEEDGSIGFSGTMQVDALNAYTEWRITSGEAGRATGTILEVYSAPGTADGEVRYESTLVDFTKSGLARGASGPPTAHRAATVRKFLRARMGK